MSAFADAPRAGSAEAKLLNTPPKCGTVDAPRAGSAEAKKFEQRTTVFGGDAPRAGSAETKVDCSDRTEEG